MIHLFERDCSVQRRHQKVVEIAPGPEPRPASCATGCAPTRCASRPRSATATPAPSSSCSTRAGNYVFIEMNPRIQVEHTVTEEVTDVDLVQSQMRIASGETLADLGLSQDTVSLRGAALQCRITTEDPANGFRPDTGKITTYRSPGGAGRPPRRRYDVHRRRGQRALRLDAGQAHLPRPDLREGRRPGPAGGRGVPDPRRVDQHPVPAGACSTTRTSRPADVTTAFIEDHPQLLTARSRADRGTKLLTYLADVTVNQPHGPAPVSARPGRPSCPTSTSSVPGPRRLAAAAARARPRGVRPRAARAAARSRSPTPRSATRTSRCSPPGSAPATCSRSPGTWRGRRPQLWSLEAWGGATYDVALRFLAEDPWERLAALRQAVPNICLQMLLRGRNTVGYTPYPTEVTDAFVQEAAATGIDVFRIFDALNDVEQMRPGDRGGARDRHAPSPRWRSATPATCPTRTRSSTRSTTTCALAERIVDAGAHVLAIKDMAGLLRAPAARTLVTALRERVRPAGAPAHPRHPRRPARDPARRDRRRRGRRRRRLRVDGRHHLAAGAVRAGRGDRPLRARDRAVAGRASAPSSRTGRRPAGSTRRSSPGCPRRPAGSTPTRSPAASSPTCASRRSPSGSARSSSRSRTCTPPPTTSSATSSR